VQGGVEALVAEAPMSDSTAKADENNQDTLDAHRLLVMWLFVSTEPNALL